MTADASSIYGYKISLAEQCGRIPEPKKHEILVVNGDFFLTGWFLTVVSVKIRSAVVKYP